MSTPIVTIDQVSKSYVSQGKDSLVLNNISFGIDKGEIISLLGKSGCGKSTLLNCIGGFEPVNSGCVLLDNQEVKKPSKRCVMLMQNYGLLPWRSVRKNVELALESTNLSKNEITTRADYYLEMVGLADRVNALPSEL